MGSTRKYHQSGGLAPGAECSKDTQRTMNQLEERKRSFGGFGVWLFFRGAMQTCPWWMTRSVSEEPVPNRELAFVDA